MNRPVTTMFLPLSVDGRITSHDSDGMDPEKWKQNPRIQAILAQFYDFAGGEVFTVTSGEAMAKLGVNNRLSQPRPLDFNLVVIDRPQMLNSHGVRYLSQNVKRLILVTLSTHPAAKQRNLPEHVDVISFKSKVDLTELMRRLKEEHQVEQVTIHSNARLNAQWLTLGLIDHLSVIISPLLVGRHGTPTLGDHDLLEVRPLRLSQAKPFGFGFVNLMYEVIND